MSKVKVFRKTLSPKQALWKHFRSYFLWGKPPTYIRLAHKLTPEQILNKGTIVDCETTGLNPRSDKILTLGILRSNKIFIYQLTSFAYNRFHSLVRRIAEKTPAPRYAYNTRFEADFLRIKEGWHDLTQYGWREDYYGENYGEPLSFRYRLIDATKSPFNEPDIESREVPRYWSEYQIRKNPKVLYEITWHCLIDLLRERQLINHESKTEDL